MKKNIFLLIILITSIKICPAQIPVDDYKTEIQNLKTEQEIDTYWETSVCLKTAIEC